MKRRAWWLLAGILVGVLNVASIMCSQNLAMVKAQGVVLALCFACLLTVEGVFLDDPPSDRAADATVDAPADVESDGDVDGGGVES